MADTGRFCFLLDGGTNVCDLTDQLRSWVQKHPSLKNLKLSGDDALGLKGNGRCGLAFLLQGSIDRLTPGMLLHDFFTGVIPRGMRVFCTDSLTSGEEWEELK